MTTKYGARVFPLDEKTALVKQTIKKGSAQNDPYVIDEHKESHVKLDDDKEIANAVRAALAGKLQK